MILKTVLVGDMLVITPLGKSFTIYGKPIINIFAPVILKGEPLLFKWHTLSMHTRLGADLHLRTLIYIFSFCSFLPVIL